MDDDENEIIEEVIMLDLDEEGRKHNKWTVGTLFLEFASAVIKAASDLFADLADASYQHGTKEIRQRELHELVTRDIEMLPEYEGEVTDG